MNAIRSIKTLNFLRIVIFIISFDLFNSNDLSCQNSIEDRIETPENFTRVETGINTFAHYLRTLPLKAKGSKVKYFNGETKNKPNVYVAVVDLQIGSSDLHQCADAIMRLRAEHFYQMKNYDAIHFNFTNGFRVDYSKWIEGYRIKTSGNKTSWIKKANRSNTYKTFWSYLEQVFMYAGTASLEKELTSVSYNNLQIGDVFIKGGFPGHAVIVVDKAKNKEGKIVFLLAQSYMPAQEIQILANPNDTDYSPWYLLDISDNIVTPEWTFTPNQLARF